jgi:hypothetical protein
MHSISDVNGVLHNEPAERDEAEPEPGLTPEVVARLRQRIAATKLATQPQIN